MTVLSRWDYRNVRDFDYLENYWKENIEGISVEVLTQRVRELGEDLSASLNIPVNEPLSKIHSEFFKEVYTNPMRNYNMPLFE